MFSLCKCNENASVRNRSEEEDSGHGGETKSTIDGAQASGGTGLSAGAGAAALAGGVGSFSTGVDKLALAEVLAQDALLVLEVLVERASTGDVAGGLEVEGTLDAVKLRSLDAVIC